MKPAIAAALREGARCAPSEGNDALQAASLGAVSTDVLIAGAGLPGLSLACALDGSGLCVTIVDRAAPRAEVAGDDDWDVRVYAISPGSAEFLQSIGAWRLIPPERLVAVETMRVAGDRGAVLTFSAHDLGQRALAWIVEERELKRALVATLGTRDVRVVAPASFDRLEFSAGAAQMTLGSGDSIDARLVVGADGVRSWVRAAAGIASEGTPYAQTAVVANFACERPHSGAARQWFRPDGGVLAWLPLPGQRVSIVWSAPSSLADELLALDAQSLAARVADAGANALGEFRTITTAAAFPLQRLALPAPIAHRVALIGDAAHVVHPLAGQGVNLGFGDAQALADVLAARGPVADAGAPVLLERYARRRAEPVLAMQTVTDGLARLFAAQPEWLATLRNAGLAAVDRLPSIKHLLAQGALR